MPNDNEVPFMLEEIVKGSKIVQEEILFMLNQVNIPQTNSYKNKVSTKRSKTILVSVYIKLIITRELNPLHDSPLAPIQNVTLFDVQT
jgi:hypothetical protein